MGHIQYPDHLLHQVVHNMHRKQMIDAHFHPQSSKRCFSRIIISWKGDPSNHLLLHVTHPCLKIKAIYTKSRGSRRIRLLLLSEKVFFLSTWDLRSLKLTLTSFMKTVTSLVSWASVSSQIVFFLLSKTENVVVNVRTLEPHPELRSNLTSWAWSPAGRQTRCSRNTAPPLHQSQVWPESKSSKTEK